MERQPASSDPNVLHALKFVPPGGVEDAAKKAKAADFPGLGLPGRKRAKRKRNAAE